MNQALRVLIADDHPLFRLGLKYMLQAQGFAVVGEAETGQQAMNCCREIPIDVAILDIKMPDGDGIQVCQTLTQDFMHLVVVLLTTFQEPALVQAARQAGAKGFLSKETSPTDLAQMIRQIVEDPERDWLPRVELPRLTPRELNVLQLMMQGSSNKQIAKQLGISIETVKEYASTCYRKLDVSDRVSAIYRARQLGIL